MKSRKEEEIHIQGPMGDLRGALILPDHPEKSVVIIHPGSGPTNRDGNNALGLEASTYEMLAEAFSAQGIGSLRIDKRGMYSSDRAIENPNDVCIADYARDLENWLDELPNRLPDCRRILFGHSEGGIVALHCDSKKYEAIILAATPGRPLKQILLQQLQSSHLDTHSLEKAKLVMGRLEKGEPVPVDQIPKMLTSLFHPAVQPYLIDLFAINPVEKASRLSRPALILQGDADLQISTLDAELLSNAVANSQLAIFEGVNHIFKMTGKSENADKDRELNLRSYSDPNLPVPSIVVDTVVNFIKNLADNGQ